MSGCYRYKTRGHADEVCFRSKKRSGGRLVMELVHRQKAPLTGHKERAAVDTTEHRHRRSGYRQGDRPLQAFAWQNPVNPRTVDDRNPDTALGIYAGPVRNLRCLITDQRSMTRQLTCGPIQIGRKHVPRG